MTDLWTRVRSLTGQTIPLLTKRSSFTVVSGDDKYLFIVPESTGKERRLWRKSFDLAEEAGLASGSATPSQLSAAEVTGRNSSYIAAILHHLTKLS